MDIDDIKRLGGVAERFNVASRSGTLDIDANGDAPAGLGCRTPATGPANDTQPLTLLGLLGLGLLGALRRRR